MSEEYEQHLKNLAKSFKSLNVQLFGFLLVAFGFLFTSNTIMSNVDFYWVTGGLAWTISLWTVSLINFLAIDFAQPGTKQPQHLFNRMRWGNWFFGVGLVVLVAVLVYLALYVAFVFQLKAGFSLGEIIFLLIVDVVLGVRYFTVVEIPRPP